MKVPKSRTALLLIVCCWWALVGCGSNTNEKEAGAESDASATYASQTTDTILVDGSSTVGPITIQVADVYMEEIPEQEIEVAISGTGAGFSEFCVGDTDISDASRPIKESEMETCAQNGIEFIELPVAFDGIAVLTNLENDFVDCLTQEELQMMWEPAAWKSIVNWQQVNSSFPDQELTLYGPGTVSGTYDYFTEAIVGDEGNSRPDFWANEDDDMLIEGIESDVTALGFFGYSYYDLNRDRLRLLAVDGGDGCVEPNTETVARGLYQPLSRPLFIYVNMTNLEAKPQIDAFVTYYLENAAQLVDDVGYIPLTDPLYELVLERYEARVTGSVFAGSGASVGVSLGDLLIKEQ